MADMGEEVAELKRRVMALEERVRELESANVAAPPPMGGFPSGADLDAVAADEAAKDATAGAGGDAEK